MLPNLPPISRFNILSDDSLPFNYIYTPKNACSSIKATLINKRVNPHELAQARYGSNRINPQKPFFLITRNPFSRFKSAYLDKIGPGNDPNVWGSICARYNLDASQTILPELLLDHFLDDDPAEIEPHFRPQYILHSYHYLKPEFTARLEEFSRINEFLSDNGFQVIRWTPHSKSGQLSTLSLSDDALLKICQLYAKDFEYYGYVPDSGSLHYPSFARSSQEISREFAIFCEYENTTVEEIVSRANEFEANGDLESAKLFLRLARVRRPAGPFINKKLLELERKG